MKKYKNKFLVVKKIIGNFLSGITLKRYESQQNERRFR